jgi:predicted transposase/invertase (TIGR01784 family)
MEKIHQAYDKSFKKFFGSTKNVKDLIQTYCVGEYAKYQNWMDFDSLRSVNTELISKKYESFRADLLFYLQLNIDGKAYDSYLVLEHKNDNDAKLIDQIKKYEDTIYEYHKTAHDAVINASKNPLILSLVFYSGKKAFNMPLHISEQSQHPELARELMQQNIIVADVNRLSIEELHTHGNIGVFECLIKKASEDELLTYITEEDTDYINEALENMNETLKESLLTFIFDAVGKKGKKEGMDMEEVFKQLTNVFNKQKETIMSLSDFFIQKGVEEGRQEGRQERTFSIAKNMLKKNTDIDFIMDVTGLPMESIRGLQMA